MTVSSASRVVVVGDGIIGLCAGVQLARRGLDVTILSPSLPGAASPASAGMLAPSVERTQVAAQAFGDAARDAWDRLASFAADAGAPPLRLERQGILHLARTDGDVDRIRASIRDGDRWLSAAEVAEFQDGMIAVAGAVLHAGDGVVDAPACLRAMRWLAARQPGVRVMEGRAHSVGSSAESLTVRTESGDLATDYAVIASGAWPVAVEGGIGPLPITPLRGTLLALNGPSLRVPVYGSDGHAYALRRGDQLLIGATADDAGFDVETRETDAARLGELARQLFADADAMPRLGTLTGLRPVTPDGRAIIGADPAQPRVIYATGHGRNGFLQAALTAEVVADVATGTPPAVDISPFFPGRFRR